MSDATPHTPSDALVKAVLVHAPHDLRVEQVPVPALAPHQVEVKIERGGICGSDLHYYHEGGFGTVRIKEPMVLGHEIAGTVVRLGSAATHVKLGQRVAVNPSLACGQCRFCQLGLQAHCLDMRFFGSAMRFPHVQGGFRERLVCHESQAVAVRDGLGAEVAAFAEPLAVCLHAIKRAGSLSGAKVLVTGSGPIGCLTILAARHAGAATIVATDITDRTLEIARRMGADVTVNTMSHADGLEAYKAEKGQFDVSFECSGHPKAVADTIACTRPRGRIVQVGIGGADMPVPINAIVAKEIELCGTFRFYEEFQWAVDLLGSGRIDVSPLHSATFGVDDAQQAFDLASDKSKAMKVQLAFG